MAFVVGFGHVSMYMYLQLRRKNAHAKGRKQAPIELHFFPFLLTTMRKARRIIKCD
jgi:hypothetical protein